MRKLPPRVKHSLPPFPSKAIFNKSIVTIEKRRIAIERFFRALVMTNYIQRRLYLLRPVKLDMIPAIGQSVDSSKFENLAEMTKRTKSIAIFNPDGNRQNSNMVSSPEGIKPRSVLSFQEPQKKPSFEFSAPIVVSSLKFGGHRTPQVLGNYTLHWKLADCLEPQTSIYFASKETNSFSLKLQHQDKGNGTLEKQHEIHLMVCSII